MSTVSKTVARLCSISNFSAKYSIVLRWQKMKFLKNQNFMKSIITPTFRRKYYFLWSLVKNDLLLLNPFISTFHEKSLFCSYLRKYQHFEDKILWSLVKIRFNISRKKTLFSDHLWKIVFYWQWFVPDIFKKPRLLKNFLTDL